MIKDLVSAKKVLKLLSESNRFLLITHQNPDGDGLGAVSALGNYLQGLGKEFDFFCVTPVNQNDKYLPLMHLVQNETLLFQKKYDVILVLDCGALDHAKVQELMERLPRGYALVNIDHHFSNKYFGEINLVDSLASSTCEIIYELFRFGKILIDKETATALLSGIIFDTSSFANDATTLKSLQIASHLLNLGARQRQINSNVLRNKHLNLLKLWGRAFERISYNPRYQMAFTVLIRKDFEDCQVEPGLLEGLTNFFNELAGAKAVMVLMEREPGLVKCSLRTTDNDLNLAEFAALFGGGGHRRAAGFSVKGNMVYNNGRWIME